MLEAYDGKSLLVTSHERDTDWRVATTPRSEKNVIAAIGALLSGITLARGLSEAREISEPDPHFEARARKYARENFFAGLNNPDPQIQNAALNELKQKKDPAFWVDTDEAMMKELGADPTGDGEHAHQLRSRTFPRIRRAKESRRGASLCGRGRNGQFASP